MNDQPPPAPWPLGRELNRDDFTTDRIERYRTYAAQHLNYQLLSTEEREASRAAFLKDHRPGEDLWLFGYGSLMWNPAIHVAETRKAWLPGYERLFCLRLVFGRATPDKPGLMLAVIAGRGCWGIAHRIAANDVTSETTILWQREMMSGAYRPVWAEMGIEGQTIRGLTFAAALGHPRLELDLDEAAQAARIASAEGVIGVNRDYLFRAAETLTQHGLADPYIARLIAQVRELAEPPLSHDRSTP